MSERPSSKSVFSPPRLVVFDLDGTLVDSFADIAAAANHALEALGREPFDVPSVTRHVGFGARELMRSLLGEGAGEEEIDRAFDFWKSYYLEHPADLSRPYPGVVETLETLRDEREMLLAVLSNKYHELSVEILRRLGLDRWFDAVQGEAAGEPRKPDPAALFRIMKRLGAGAEETLMVGDGAADVQVARNAGVPSVGVDYGVSTSADLERLGASTVIGSLPELLGLF